AQGLMTGVGDEFRCLYIEKGLLGGWRISSQFSREKQRFGLEDAVEDGLAPTRGKKLKLS
ncbi:hypothetical protein, partial [Alcaligenes nematophilus]